MSSKIHSLINENSSIFTRHPLLLKGPAGLIEATQSTTTTPAFPYHIAIICHPHPLYGGTMDNKVVYTIARTLHELGMPTIRFNFRGVGRSKGQYDNGIGEAQDLTAVIQQAQQRYPGYQLFLAGFSFGAYIALKIAGTVQPNQLITVAPPVNLFDFSQIQPPNCPWLLIQGNQDEVVPQLHVADWANRLINSPDMQILDGVGHFFHGHLNALKTTLQNKLANAIYNNEPLNSPPLPQPAVR